MISIAIDGPSGAGKSSLSRRLAAELGYIYVDTGAMYRTIGLYVLRSGADTEDEDAVAALLSGIRLEMRYVDGVQHMFLNGEDVSGLIRTEEVSMAASHVRHTRRCARSCWTPSVHWQRITMCLWMGATSVLWCCPVRR